MLHAPARLLNDFIISKIYVKGNIYHEINQF
nr:MAG TPA: hypothetical protein [Caudoviricetes sp.]